MFILGTKLLFCMLIILSVLLLSMWSIAGIFALRYFTTKTKQPQSSLQIYAIFISCGPISWMLCIICLIIDLITGDE